MRGVLFYGLSERKGWSSLAGKECIQFVPCGRLWEDVISRKPGVECGGVLAGFHLTGIV